MPAHDDEGLGVNNHGNPGLPPPAPAAAGAAAAAAAGSGALGHTWRRPMGPTNHANPKTRAAAAAGAAAAGAAAAEAAAAEGAAAAAAAAAEGAAAAAAAAASGRQHPPVTWCTREQKEWIMSSSASGHVLVRWKQGPQNRIEHREGGRAGDHTRPAWPVASQAGQAGQRGWAVSGAMHGWRTAGASRPPRLLPLGLPPTPCSCQRPHPCSSQRLLLHGMPALRPHLSSSTSAIVSSRWNTSPVRCHPCLPGRKVVHMGGPGSGRSRRAPACGMHHELRSATRHATDWRGVAQRGACTGPARLERLRPAKQATSAGGGGMYTQPGEEIPSILCGAPPPGSMQPF